MYVALEISFLLERRPKENFPFTKASGSTLLLEEKFHLLLETDFVFSTYVTMFPFIWEEHADSFS